MSDSQQTEKTYKVFVGNVPYLCTDEEFQAAFQGMAGLVSADIVRKPNSNMSRGFGFVSFETQEQANSLLNHETMELRGRELRFSSYDYQKEEKSYLVFVRGVPTGMDSDGVKQVMDQLAPVKEVTLNLNRETNEPTGSAVVGFSTLEEMKKVLEARSQAVDDNVTLQIYPYRKYPRRFNRDRLYRNAREAYRAGFQAGQMLPELKAPKAQAE